MLFNTGVSGQFFQIDSRNDQTIENLLSEVQSTDVEAVRKARAFYDSCNNQTANGNEDDVILSLIGILFLL